MKRLMLLAALLMLAPACRGPKGSPGGTVKSFFSAIVANDWDAMTEIASDKSMSKLGSGDRANQWFAKNYRGWVSADVTIDEELIDNSEVNATVHFTCIQTTKENYKEVQYDCSDVYTLVKQADGKWHLHLPGSTKLRSM
ncbi:MAG: nuclear transport factor 2 family protein [Archangium sp.]